MSIRKNDTIESSPRPKWRDKISLLVTLIAGSVLTLLAGSGLQQAEVLRISERQRATTQIVANTLQTELTRTSEALRNAGLMIEANPQLTREQFNRHMRNVVENQLSVNLIEWQPIVPASELAKFEAAVRMTGLPDFRVVQPDASGKGWEAVHGRSEYVPVLYFWPEAYRTGGLDMSFSPERMASKLQSRALRLPVASGVFDFIKEGKAHSGTLAMAISTAVFGADGTAKGYVAAIVDLTTLFQSATRLADRSEFDLLVFGSGSPEDTPIYSSVGAESDLKQVSTGLRVATSGDPSATVEVAHQTWRLVLHPRPAFYEEVQEYGSLLAFVASTGMTLLLILYLYQVQNSRRTIERAEATLRKIQNQLQASIDNMPVAYILWGADLKVIEWNKAAEKIFGYSKEEMLGKNPIEYIVPESTRPLVADVLGRLQAGEVTDYSEYPERDNNIRKDGELISCQWVNAPLGNRDGGAVSLLTVAQDITERKQTEDALRKSETLFHNYFELGQVGMAITSIEKRWLNVNARLCEMLGYTRDELTRMTWTELTHPDDLEPDLAQFGRLLSGEIERYEMDKRFIHKRGNIIHTHLTVACQRYPDNSIEHVIASLQDISGRKRLEEEIRQMAFHDPLTRLPNRRLMEDRMNQVMAASKRSGLYGALMFIDLDNFKPLNDAHGHGVGDLLLIKVADRLRSCVREMDTVARFGGDEFVVMLSELDMDKAESTSQAETVAEKIRAAMSEPYRLTIRREGKTDATVEHCCSASIGVALFIDHEATQDEVLKCADMAMYQAKEAGRNLILFHDPKD